MFPDRLDASLAALRLAHHADQPGLGQHGFGKLVHARRGGRAGGADHFIAHRVNRPDVINETVGKIHAGRQFLAARQHIHDAFMRRITPCQQLAGQQHGFSRLPLGNIVPRQRIEIHPPRISCGMPVHIRIVFQLRRRELRHAAAIQCEMDMSRGRAIGNQRHRLGCSMGRVIQNLDIQHRGQATQPLRTDAQRIHPVANLDAQLFSSVFCAARLELGHVDGLHQRFFRQQHRLLRGAADADAQHPRRTPARAHARQLAQHPLRHIVARIQHGEARLVLRTAALGADAHIHFVAWHQLKMHHRRRIVAGVLARSCRVANDGRTQHILRLQISLAHPGVYHLGNTLRRTLPAHLHAHPHKRHHDAGVLAQRPLPLRAHARVGQDLRHRILRRRRLLALIGRG